MRLDLAVEELTRVFVLQVLLPQLIAKGTEVDVVAGDFCDHVFDATEGIIYVEVSFSLLLNVLQLLFVLYLMNKVPLRHHGGNQLLEFLLSLVEEDLGLVLVQFLRVFA